jgi:heat shock protein HslJ
MELTLVRRSMMRSVRRYQAAIVCTAFVLAIGSIQTRGAAAQGQEVATTEVAVPETESVEDIAWTLVELGGQPVIEGGGLAEPPLTLLLDPTEKRIGGYGGVNWFNGGYQLDGDRLSLGPLATTLRAGPPELMEQEQRIQQALGRARQAVIVDGMLELRAGDEVLARYQRR